jgi:prepilin-type N-terminal cleavage/methylation domain-containing protein
MIRHSGTEVDYNEGNTVHISEKKSLGSAGFTLLELVLTVIILSVILMPMVMVITSGFDSYFQGQTIQQLTLDAKDAMLRISRDVARSGHHMTTAGDGGSYPTHVADSTTSSFTVKYRETAGGPIIEQDIYQTGALILLSIDGGNPIPLVDGVDTSTDSLKFYYSPGSYTVDVSFAVQRGTGTSAYWLPLKTTVALRNEE